MYHCQRRIRFAAMFIDLMCTVNLKHFGQVCTQASELIAHTQWLLLRVFRCPTYGRRCWLLRNWNLDKQSKSKSGLHSSPADNWLCTASSKWKQSCPDRLVSRSSLRWCQVHKEALPATRKPEWQEQSRSATAANNFNHFKLSPVIPQYEKNVTAT